MTKEQRVQMETVLETMLDRHGIVAVCEALADISRGKAEHIRTNWQEEPPARRWEQYATRFEKVPR